MIIEKNTAQCFMNISTILREYNDGLLAQKSVGLGHNIPIID